MTPPAHRKAQSIATRLVRLMLLTRLLSERPHTSAELLAEARVHAPTLDRNSIYRDLKVLRLAGLAVRRTPGLVARYCIADDGVLYDPPKTPRATVPRAWAHHGF